MAMPPGNVVISDKMQFPAGGGGVATAGGVSAGGGGNEMHHHHRQQWFPVDERDGFILWLRGEFAAANAIIDSLCHHLRTVGEPGEYDFVIGCIQQRRCNWNPVLHMQQYFSIGEVMLALQDVALKRQQQQQQQQQHRYHYDQPKGGVKDFKRSSFNRGQRGSVGIGSGEVVKEAINSSIENRNLDRNSMGNVSIQKFVEVKSDEDGGKLEDRGFVVAEDKKGVNADTVADSHLNKPGKSEGSLCQNSETEAASADNQSSLKEDNPHNSHNQNERRNLNITPKTFVGIEMIDGKQVNVVDGLKLYEKLLDEAKVSVLVSLINDLRARGKRGQLPGPTYVVSKRPMKGHGREMIQLGTAVADAPAEDDNAAGISKDRRVESIPPELQNVIESLVDKQVMTVKPDSCIIDIYNEGDHSQPHMYPSWYGKPVYALLLTECDLTFGRVIVADRPGDYRGSLRLGLLPGSLLVMQGKSSDFARHAISAIREQRIIITLTKSEPKKFPTTDGQRFPSPAAAPSSHWGPPPSRSPNHIRHSVPKHYAPIPTTGVLPAPSIRSQMPPPSGVPPIFVTTPVAAPVPYPAPVPIPPVSTGWPAAPPRHPQNRLAVPIPGTGVFLPPPGSGNAPSSTQLPTNLTNVSSVETTALSERENGSVKTSHGTNASPKEKTDGTNASPKEKTDGKTHQQECNGNTAVTKEEQSQQNIDHEPATKSAGSV